MWNVWDKQIVSQIQEEEERSRKRASKEGHTPACWGLHWEVVGAIAASGHTLEGTLQVEGKNARLRSLDWLC